MRQMRSAGTDKSEAELRAAERNDLEPGRGYKQDSTGWASWPPGRPATRLARLAD